MSTFLVLGVSGEVSRMDGLSSVLLFEFLFRFLLFLLFCLYFLQFLLDVFFTQILSFNSSGRAEQQIGRQRLYGELLDGGCIPSGEIAALFPFQGISFDCFFPFLSVDVQGNAPKGE